MSHQYDWWEGIDEAEQEINAIKSALSDQVRLSTLPNEAWVTIATLKDQSVLGLGFVYGMLSERLREGMQAEVAMTGKHDIEVGGHVLHLTKADTIAIYDDIRITKTMKIQIYLKRLDWVPDELWNACLTGKYKLPCKKSGGHERTAIGTRLRVRYGDKKTTEYIEHTGLI